MGNPQLRSLTVQAGDGVALSMDALLGTSSGADDVDPLGLGLPNMGLQPLTMSAPGVQHGSPLSPIVALHNGMHTPSPFAMPQARGAQAPNPVPDLPHALYPDRNVKASDSPASITAALSRARFRSSPAADPTLRW